MFRSILEREGIDADAAVVIGDNPDADMVAAHRAGIRSVLMLTGVTDAAMVAGLDGERRPDFVVADGAALRELLDSWLAAGTAGHDGPRVGTATELG
jgi:ribonucleotide monophosphatase NagD (HAD superfamily)